MSVDEFPAHIKVGIFTMHEICEISRIYIQYIIRDSL
jgi:hypothetical protein